MENARSLWQLAPGHRAWVGELSAQGELRRQLRDLGFVPGAQVECLGRSFFVIGGINGIEFLT